MLLLSLAVPQLFIPLCSPTVVFDLLNRTERHEDGIFRGPMKMLRAHSTSLVSFSFAFSPSLSLFIFFTCAAEGGGPMLSRMLDVSLDALSRHLETFSGVRGAPELKVVFS